MQVSEVVSLLSPQKCVRSRALRTPSLHPGVSCTPVHPGGISAGFRHLTRFSFPYCFQSWMGPLAPGHPKEPGGTWSWAVVLSHSQCHRHMVCHGSSLQRTGFRMGLMYLFLLPVFSFCRTRVSVLILEFLMKLRSNE